MKHLYFQLILFVIDGSLASTTRLVIRFLQEAINTISY
jgi:hypothetical protein